MVTTALCMAVIVMSVVSVAMLVLVARVGHEANGLETKYRDALFAYNGLAAGQTALQDRLSNALGQHGLAETLAANRLEAISELQEAMTAILKAAGMDDGDDVDELIARVRSLVESKGKLDRYRAAIDEALGGVRLDGQSWTQAHIPAIERLIAEHNRRGLR